CPASHRPADPGRASFKKSEGSGAYFNTYRSSSQNPTAENARSRARRGPRREDVRRRGEAFRLPAQARARAHRARRSEQEDALDDVEQPEGDAEQQDHLHGKPRDGEITAVLRDQERDDQSRKQEPTGDRDDPE